jgi:hypothetical protein
MGCSKCYVGLQFIFRKIQQHEINFFVFFVFTYPFENDYMPHLIVCTIYMAIYRYHLYNAKTLSKMKFNFLWQNTMVKKTLCEGCKGCFLKTKGTKTITFLGEKCQNLSYLNSTFLRQVKQSKILIFSTFLLEL